MAFELARRGHEVEVLSFSKDMSLPVYGFSSGVSPCNLWTHRQTWRAALSAQVARRFIPSGRLTEAARFSLMQAPFVAALRAHYRNNRPDVVIGFMGSAISAIDRVGAALAGVPVIASLHNHPHRLFQPRDAKARATLSALARAAAVSFPLEEHFADLEADTGTALLRVLPNPIEIPEKPVRDLPRECLVIGVGRLVPVKRFDMLLRSWALVASAFPEWRLAIYGEGPERPRLEAMISELGLNGQVTLPGATERIFEIYSRASLLVHPSQFEGFGLVLAEAMARGTPVIGFAATPAVRSLVIPGQNGWLITEDASDMTLSKAMNSAMLDTQSRQFLSERAPQSVQKYELTRVLDKWDALFDDLRQDLQGKDEQ
ncbi:hypothetical protein P775_19475 [Puniceibacterium antarcticum]|uniref:Glycosyl transferase family 1 domain-containing protein n=1 Tax=Puniceibacterium antarcticum TaxID=1206336 RepID=A0A2G8RBF1_9RHOB|nr:hypothetical protein P775_19475 [Puniceibacterium antarcticum]